MDLFCAANVNFFFLAPLYTKDLYYTISQMGNGGNSQSQLECNGNIQVITLLCVLNSIRQATPGVNTTVYIVLLSEPPLLIYIAQAAQKVREQAILFYVSHVFDQQ